MATQVKGPQNFNETKIALHVLVEEIRRKAKIGLERASVIVEGTAVNTDSYYDDTTATRNSTMVSVTTAEEYPGPVYAQSLATAYLFRENGGDPDNVPPAPAPNEIVMDLIVSTHYATELALRYGGATNFVGDAQLMHAGETFDIVCRSIGELFT
jgi:hypothetical protein